MRKLVRLTSIFAAAALMLGSVSVSAAVVNGNAARYEEQFYGNGIPYADYLIDFDGDGSDEHFLLRSFHNSASNTYEFEFQVWAGDRKLVHDSYQLASGYPDDFIEGIICTGNGDPNRKYLMLKGSVYQTDDYVFYSVVDGQWAQTEKWHTEYARGRALTSM